MSAGLSLTLHYCGDKVETIGLSEDLSCCCEGEMEMQSNEDDCCKNEIKEVKISLDQIKENIDTKKFQSSVFLAISKNTFLELFTTPLFEKIPTPTPIPQPPDKTLFPSIYQLTQSYLFYS